MHVSCSLCSDPPPHPRERTAKSKVTERSESKKSRSCCKFWPCASSFSQASTCPPTCSGQGADAFPATYAACGAARAW